MQPPIDDPFPLSALQHALFCRRQCALIHLDRAWEENRLTAEGRVLHQASDRGESRRRQSVRTVTALPLASRRLGIVGVADMVEFRQEADREVPFPVEYKRGKPKLHRADEVQLCAQGLCLEEMTGGAVLEGALFYGETRRRVVVPFDEDLRALTERTVAEVRALLSSDRLPPAEYAAGKCRACSLAEVCRPKLAGRSARAWRYKALEVALSETVGTS